MSTPLSVYMHFQVDFRELMVKKRDIIESEPQLFEMVGKPTEPVTCSNEVCDYIGMGRLQACTVGHYCISSNMLLS